MVDPGARGPEGRRLVTNDEAAGPSSVVGDQTTRLPAAVLWDMDGTLVDSEGLWSITMAELAAHLGGELSAATREELTGSSLRRTVTTVLREVGRPDDEAAVDEAKRTIMA